MHEAGGKGIERLPGAKELLDALRAGGARWGICTSGEPCSLLRSLLATVAELLIAATRTYASSALKTGEIGAEPPALPFLVTANDVTHGKPHPEPYLKGLDGASCRPCRPAAAQVNSSRPQSSDNFLAPPSSLPTSSSSRMRLQGSSLAWRQAARHLVSRRASRSSVSGRSRQRLRRWT